MTTLTVAGELPKTQVHRGSLVQGALIVAIAGQPLIKPGGPGNSSPVDLLVALAIFVVLLWSSSGAQVFFPYVVPGTVLVAVDAASGLFSAYPSASLLAVTQTGVLLVWVGVVATSVREPRFMRTVLVAWSASSIAWAAILLLGELTRDGRITGIRSQLGDRASLTFGDPNYAALYFVISCFVVYATGWPRRRALRTTGYLLLLSGVAFTGSNGGILELAVAFGLACLLAVRRRWGTPAMVAGLLSVILVGGATFQAISLGQVQSWADRTRQPLLVNSIGRSSQSASERGTLIHESWELFTTNPFLGSGPSTTKAVLTARNAPYQKEAHDDYLGALVEEGVLGLGALLFLFVTVATRAARMLYRGVAAEVLEVLVHPEGLVAALASVFVAGLYYETLHFRFVWILFALIAGAQLRDGARSRGQYAGAAG